MDSEMLKKKNEKSNFMVYNGMRVKSFRKDCAEIELNVGAHALNPYGIVHGGVLYAMADCAAGAAARSDGKTYVTLRGSLNYLQAASEGTITARSVVVYRGGTTCGIRVEITGEEDVLLAEGDFTMFCVKRTPEHENTSH